jgi:4-alpha-glucanotransferase
LYRDLAIGSSAAGAEVWSNPDVVVGKAHAGAPPDILNPAGQDWSLPPFNPRILRESGYAPFIELVRANMRYCGALRIDHVVGLQHLYWVPAGHKPHEGAYVTYPFNDLAGILALESQRNHCLVVGEDLGTVPPGFSEKLNERGILSYRVLYFEKTANRDNSFHRMDTAPLHSGPLAATILRPLKDGGSTMTLRSVSSMDSIRIGGKAIDSERFEIRKNGSC